MVDDVAMSNRCLWDATAAAHDEYQTVGDNARAGTVRVPFQDSIQGYQVRPNLLRPMDLVLLPSTDFNGYATHWEQRYSALIRDGLTMKIVPIVDNKPYIKNPIPGNGDFYPVIGHYGVVSVLHILVRRKFATKSEGNERVKALQAVLDQDIAYVEQNYPKAGDWGSFNTDHNLWPNRFELLIDPEGRILAIMGESGSEPGLIAEDPISDVIAAVSLLKLATAGTRIIFHAVSRRAAKRAALKAALGPTPIPRGLISKGATPPGMRQSVPDPFTGTTSGVTARAGTTRSLRTGIDASGAEFESFKQAVFEKGEIGIQSPGGANVSGVDFITARRGAGGKMEVLLNDATVNARKVPKTTAPSTWVREATDAVAQGRLDLGDAALELEVRDAVTAGRLSVCTLTVNLTPQGSVNTVGW